jgi:hypothetical protein
MDFQLDSNYSPVEDDGISVQNQILEQQYKLLKSKMKEMDKSVKRALNIFTDSLDNLIIEGVVFDNNKQIKLPDDYNNEKLKDAIQKYEQSIRYLESQIKTMEELILHKMSGKKIKIKNIISHFKNNLPSYRKKDEKNNTDDTSFI